jgi:hypothetical protein
VTIRSESIHSCCFVLITLILASILLLPGCQRTPSVDDGVAAVETGLLPPVALPGDTPYALAERMQFYHVPGVSIAVIGRQLCVTTRRCTASTPTTVMPPQ